MKEFVVNCWANETHRIWIDEDKDEIILLSHPEMDEDMLTREAVVATLAGEELPVCLQAWKAWKNKDMRAAPTFLKGTLLIKMSIDATSTLFRQ